MISCPCHAHPLRAYSLSNLGQITDEADDENNSKINAINLPKDPW